jgi:hypothetical protein
MRIPFAIWQIDAMALGKKNQMLGHFDTVFVTDEAVFMTYETNEQRERDGQMMVFLTYDHERLDFLTYHGYLTITTSSRIISRDFCL